MIWYMCHLAQNKEGNKEINLNSLIKSLFRDQVIENMPCGGEQKNMLRTLIIVYFKVESYFLELNTQYGSFWGIQLYES